MKKRLIFNLILIFSIFLLETKPLFSGDFIITQKAPASFDKQNLQVILDSANNKLYYVWREYDGRYYQIWTAVMNTDGTGWSATKQTTSPIYSKSDPQLVLDSTNNKLHYAWHEGAGGYPQIWTAEMNTDGTGWSATKQTSSSYIKYRPQLVLDSTNNKLYYVWEERDGSYYQIWTAEMNTDGTGWSVTKQTTSLYNKERPQLVMDSTNNKLYYLWREDDGSFYQIWTAEMNTDGTGWSATKRTTSAYKKNYPQLLLDNTNNKLHYVWHEYDGSKYQIWTAEMNSDGTGWAATQKTTSAYDKGQPQLVLDSINNKLHYVWEETEGSPYQIWTAEMNTDGTGWSATKQTTSGSKKFYPQLVLDSTNNKFHYVWQELEGSLYQIWTAEMNSDGSGWSETKQTISSYNKNYFQLILDSINNKLHYVWSQSSLWTTEMNTDGTGWSAIKRTGGIHPQLVLDSTNNKLYYVWCEGDTLYYQIWTAEINTDGTGWSATKQTSSNYNKVYPQLVLDSTNNKFHYVWYEYDGSNQQIWTAEMNTDGTGWSETKQTTSVYDKYKPQLVLDSANNKLYYVWYESDGINTQIWTAEMNTDGTGWSATKQTTSAYNKSIPQLVLDSTNNKLYYVWYETDGANSQIWTAEMNTNGTGWAATKRTTSAYNKSIPQLVLDSTNNKLHYVWQEDDGNYYQIWTAEMNTNGTGWSETQRTISTYGRKESQLVLDSTNNQIHYIWRGDYGELFVAVYNLDASEPNVSPSWPTSLECEEQTNPTGITDTTPEFSAIYNDSNIGDIANKYRIQVSTQSDFQGTMLWDSGASGTSMANTTQGNRSPLIIYAGGSFSLQTEYFWRIKFWDDGGLEGEWSIENAIFTTPFVLFGKPIELELVEGETTGVTALQNDTSEETPPTWTYGQNGWYFTDANDTVIIDSFTVTNPPSEDITNVILKVRYAAEGSYDGGNYIQWATDESSYYNTDIHPEPNQISTFTATYDLYSQGIDTLEEIENLNIKFVATDAGQGGGVSFDYIWIQINPDVTVPDSIITFSAQTGVNLGEIDLSWTASGDDGNTGDITNGQYHIKYSATSTDTWDNMPYEIKWSTDTSPGNSENKTIDSLTEGVIYYFYIKTADEVPNWSDLSNKVNAVAKQDSNISISIDSSAYDFGTVIKGSTNIILSSITVTNNGGVNERYSLHLAAPTGWSCVTDSAPGAEKFRMCGNFQTATAQSSHFVIAVSSSDAIGTTQMVCTNADFAKDNENEGAKGYNVPPGQDRYLWFRFEAPTSTTLITQQTITITITAEQQP